MNKAAQEITELLLSHPTFWFPGLIQTKIFHYNSFAFLKVLLPCHVRLDRSKGNTDCPFSYIFLCLKNDTRSCCPVQLSVPRFQYNLLSLILSLRKPHQQVVFIAYWLLFPLSFPKTFACSLPVVISCDSSSQPFSGKITWLKHLSFPLLSPCHFLHELQSFL